MRNRRQWIPIVLFLGVVAAAAYMVVQLNAQETTVSGDYANAAAAEVRDVQGRVVLHGPFAAADEEDGEIERKAALQPTGILANASGEAEVEYARSSPGVQEIEFSIRNVEAGVTYTFWIDGHEVGSATANTRGRVELEVEARTGDAKR